MTKKNMVYVFSDKNEFLEYVQFLSTIGVKMSNKKDFYDPNELSSIFDRYYNKGEEREVAIFFWVSDNNLCFGKRKDIEAKEDNLYSSKMLLTNAIIKHLNVGLGKNRIYVTGETMGIMNRLKSIGIKDLKLELAVTDDFTYVEYFEDLYPLIEESKPSKYGAKFLYESELITSLNSIENESVSDFITLYELLIELEENQLEVLLRTCFRPQSKPFIFAEELI